MKATDHPPPLLRQGSSGSSQQFLMKRSIHLGGRIVEHASVAGLFDLGGSGDLAG
jgi:hypothetical protein